MNRGVVSRYALARLDVKRLGMSAEEQTNFMPRAFGPMSIRPGLGYIGPIPDKAKMIPFVFNIDETALCELTDSQMRVWVADSLVSRTVVGAIVTNGDFVSSLDGWTVADEADCTTEWHPTGVAQLVGSGTNSAILRQTVATGVNLPNNIAHGLRIVISRGPVMFRCGHTVGGDSYVKETTLETGVHSLSIVPQGPLYLQFSNKSQAKKMIDSVQIEAAGVMTIPTSWTEADLPNIRFAQSGDVIFVACKGQQQKRIERRAAASWSVVDYKTEDGPFRVENVSNITIAPSTVRTGNCTLTASKGIFKREHIGALWKVDSVGQQVYAEISSENVFTDPIRVTSVGEERRFSIVISGTFEGETTLQRSVGMPGIWEDIQAHTSIWNKTWTDELDNQVIYYRIGVKTGDYVSGTVTVSLSCSSGSITGVGRITDYNDETSVNVEVLKDFGGTTANDVWSEGLWSEYRGWPSSVALHDGRLWWSGKDRHVGSITDSFHSFDDSFEGDAGPISRSIGFGPVDSINWMLSLSRLISGTDMAELSCRSSSFDEPLTPTNFTIKKFGSQGTANIQAVEVDNKGIFVQRGGQRLYELSYALDGGDYNELDLTQLCPEFLSPGISMVAVQRQPDTRIHCVRTDGTVGVLVYDRAENLICWVNVVTDGLVEDVVVLPATIEDAVYYVVNRANGRYLEKWALESECRGGSVNKIADSFVFKATENDKIEDLDHLEGETVVAWADGVSLGSFVVSGGNISLPGSFVNRMAGLPYRARFKSSKLAYIAPPGQSALGAVKKIHQLGLVLADTHPSGIVYGPDFDTMDAMPMMEGSAPVDQDTVHENYEEGMFTFPGSWTTDARLCLESNAPFPVTVMAAVLNMTSNP
jgi:hypothetical protein